MDIRLFLFSVNGFEGLNFLFLSVKIKPSIITPDFHMVIL